MSSRNAFLGIIKQGASVAGTRLLLIVASFVSSIVVARALPVEERGLFGLLMAVGALGIQFGNFGLPVANTYLVARDPGLLSALVSNTTRVFLWMMGFLAVSGVLALWMVPAWSPLWGAAGVMVWLVAVVGLVQMLAQNLLAGRFLFSVSNGVDVMARLGAIGAMVVLWLCGVVTAVWFAFAASLFGLFATVWGLRQGGIALALQDWDSGLGRRQLRFGSRAYVACLASFIVSRLPLYSVSARGGLDGAAYFTQALVIADTMLVIPNALGTVLFPNLAAARDASVRISSTLRLALVTSALMLLAVAAVWVLGPLVLPMVYGKAYAASMPLLLMMLPGVAALGICGVMQNALCANGYPWTATASPLAGVAAVSSGLALSNTVAGCAWAYTLGAAIMLLVSSVAWWFHRHEPGVEQNPAGDPNSFV